MHRLLLSQGYQDSNEKRFSWLLKEGVLGQFPEAKIPEMYAIIPWSLRNYGIRTVGHHLIAPGRAAASQYAVRATGVTQPGLIHCASKSKSITAFNKKIFEVMIQLRTFRNFQ